MIFVHTQWFKLTLLGLMLLFLLLQPLLAQPRRRILRWATLAVAVVAVAGGLLSLTGRAFPWERHFLNNHDVYHYYFGAKYSDELGFTKLYHCTIVALDEINPKSHASVKKIRSLVHYNHVNKKWYLDRPNLCKDNFSPQRWAQFKQDLQDFSTGRAFSWQGFLRDKGYNPSPIWNLVGRFWANQIPPQPPVVFNLLGVLDVALLVLALLIAFLAFGWWGPALTILYLGATWSLTPGHIRGGFLRLDWLALLLVGLAALRTKHHRIAGACFAYAAAVRVFPVIFLFGPAVLALRETIRTRRVPRPALRLFTSFAVVAALLGGATVLDDGGFQRWPEFRKKIQLHDRDISTMRLGLEVLLVFRGEHREADLVDEQGRHGFRTYWVGAKQRLMAKQKPLHLGLAAGLLLVLGTLLWKRERDEVAAVAFSFPAVFALVNPTFYYYCLLAVPVLGLAASWHRPRLRLVLAGLVAFEVYCQISMRLIRFEVLQYALQSVVLAVIVLYTLVVLAWPLRRSAAAPVLPRPDFCLPAAPPPRLLPPLLIDNEEPSV
ncbi:MAG: hypothetical protein RBU45_22115 [Myxococcota bacterium]|jgi:hypothetical protein|nr:hypothetical protein [Myxococcota bacterium]